MTNNKTLSGIFCPVITPFDAKLKVDTNRLISQCRWLLSQNISLAVFGTTSEANSLSIDEKIYLLDQLIDAGIDANRLLPGTGCCALPDTIRLTSHAVKLGCAGILMLPPFYYKEVSDQGIYEGIAKTIQSVGSHSMRIYLYHIPQMAGAGFSLKLIDRLVSEFPCLVAGIKDSSGNWENTKAMLNCGWDDFSVFVGSETFLLKNMQHGGAGCISATANINPAAIDDLYQNWQLDGAEELQQALNQVRDTTAEYPMIPALKAVIAEFFDDDGWRNVRPPLIKLDQQQSGDLAAILRRKGLKIRGPIPT